jgi:hypothetical protein
MGTEGNMVLLVAPQPLAFAADIAAVEVAASQLVEVVAAWTGQVVQVGQAEPSVGV